MIKIIEKFVPAGVRLEEYGNIYAYEMKVDDIVSAVNHLYFIEKLPLKLITTMDERKESGSFRVMYIFGIPKENLFIAPYIRLKGSEEFPSMVKTIHEASGYERKIKTFFGLDPIGHPNPRPVILHGNWPKDVFPLRKDFDWRSRPAETKNDYAFTRVEGEGIYEIPVGPVHAGIIEPGHFRFSVAGEEIVLLEPKLGYKHRGVEKLFEILPLEEKLKLSERVSGDSSFSHSLAFCQAVEALGGVEVSAEAANLRLIYAELERLANHLGDIGAIMIDTGFSFGGSHGARLREMVMRLNERLTGSRYLRGVNAIGGVTKDISPEAKDSLLKDLEALEKDFSEVMAIAENSNSLFNRLKETGTLNYQIALDHGTVGVAGRAVGILNDARLDYPYAAYPDYDLEIASETKGDVYSRFYVRVKEVYSSIKLIEQALQKYHGGKILNDKKIELKKNSLAVGIVEGWRGDIVYFVATDAQGEITRVEPRDPSFLNWTVLGHAGKGNVVPDFPLINKSFNLSYSGNDL